MKPDELIDELGYRKVPENWVTVANAEPETAHLWRTAQAAKVLGSYVFRTSPKIDPILPSRPAIHVAQALDEAEARRIHQQLWNLGNAPFLIVILPHQVRVYSGFNYDTEDETVGWIKTAKITVADIREKLKDFYADEIDSGRIWHSQSEALTPDRRVDQHLLKNLKELGDTLVKDRNISPTIAHALIGKYIYIRFLEDRKILSNEWLEKHGINLDDVVGPRASLSNLRNLVDALEVRFNGKIFPLDLTDTNNLSDEVISFVASVFRGDDPISGQLALNFKAFDFYFIPVETLSSIYEQFLRREGKGKKHGAVYTREFLADYLLCELNSVKPLKSGMRVLDPACGSGVFLVLAYRRLIEEELQKNKKENLPPERLREILEESIYGVEQSLDACYVTELSLILTLLSYVDPPELHKNEAFQFPELHNKNIFQCDIFDDSSMFWKKGMVFQWIAGNPPWNKLESDTAEEDQPYAWQWMHDEDKSANKPVGKYSLSEAFAWRVTNVLDRGGYVGLLIHATSLFNNYSTKYRQEFFKQHQVARLTNFANLAYILFAGRAKVPAATIIYTVATDEEEKPPIIHYGPLVANQAFYRFRADRNKGKLKLAWTIIIYEDEIQAVDPYEAESGEALVWKLALWGTHRDKHALAQFNEIFPTVLSETVHKRKWKLRHGSELRNIKEEAKKEKPDELKHVPEYSRFKRLDASSMSGKFYLSVPPEFLHDIPEDELYVRVRSGDAGLEVATQPHIFWSATSAAYSDMDFIIPSRQVGLSSPTVDKDYLRALSAYLNSSIGQYLLFFHSAEWGINRSRIAKTDVKSLPVPDFSDEQIATLSGLHRQLSQAQLIGEQAALFNDTAKGQPMTAAKVRIQLDNEVARTMRVPSHLEMLAADFVQMRYQFIQGKTPGAAAKPATVEDLLNYARYLTEELDDFADTHHKVSVKQYPNLVVCTVEITNSSKPFKPVVEEDRSSSTESPKELWEDLEQRFSQWMYVQRGLRIFEGTTAFIYKSPRLLNWTRTQAWLDSDDIITEVLNDKVQPDDPTHQKSRMAPLL